MDKPAVRDCLKCQDPHSSDNKFPLVKATAGDQKENLCLACHTTGLNVPEKGSHHTALDMGCETCHVTDKTGERGNLEFDYHLTKVPPALCADCHDSKDAGLQKTHRDQPFGTANCIESQHRDIRSDRTAKFHYGGNRAKVPTDWERDSSPT